MSFAKCLASGTIVVDRIRVILSERVVGLPSWVLLTQLFIGLGWLRAVAEKVIDPNWLSGATLTAFARDHRGSTIGWYEPVLDTIVLPVAPLIAVVVLAGQVFAAISLTTGRQLRVGLTIGMFLNLNFLAAGAVAPSAFYLLAQGSIALWMTERTNAAKSGRYLERLVRTAVVLAAISLPFIQTVHPAEVIDDPAVMFVFGGILTAIVGVLASRPSASLNLAQGHNRAQPPGPGSGRQAESATPFSSQVGPR